MFSSCSLSAFSAYSLLSTFCSSFFLFFFFLFLCFLLVLFLYLFVLVFFSSFFFFFLVLLFLLVLFILVLLLFSSLVISFGYFVISCSSSASSRSACSFRFSLSAFSSYSSRRVAAHFPIQKVCTNFRDHYFLFQFKEQTDRPLACSTINQLN